MWVVCFRMYDACQLTRPKAHHSMKAFLSSLCVINLRTKQNSVLERHMLKVHILCHSPDLPVGAQRWPVALSHSDSGRPSIQFLEIVEERKGAEQKRRSHHEPAHKSLCEFPEPILSTSNDSSINNCKSKGTYQKVA